MADYFYEKFENGDFTRCPMDDKDGSICGHIVIGLPRWFDENPEERIRLGWVKHITHKRSEVDYDPQTQFLLTTVREIDAYTREDVYHVRTKSEEQLAFEEMLNIATGDTGFVFG